MNASAALHDLVTVLRAPSTMLSTRGGQLRAGGAQGFYRHDRRVLSLLRIDISGVAPIAVGHRFDGADRAIFHAVIPGLPVGAALEGPSVHLRRERLLTDDQLVETVELVNLSDESIPVRVRLVAATDLVGVNVVNSGVATSLVRPEINGHQVRWTRDGCRTVLHTDPAPTETTVEAATAALSWDAVLAQGQRWRVRITVGVHEDLPMGFQPQRPARPMRLAPPSTGVPDRSCARLLRRSLADLDGLLLADPGRADSIFLAAGSPWYLTLFGRDSLWAARLVLPLSIELAEGTLWALATRQGRGEDRQSEEQPGKIPHEVRRGDFEWSGAVQLPPLYYGTVDATALWVCLLHEAWRAGLGPDRVEPLLPHLRAALEWIAGWGAAHDDGFVKYIGSTTTGLVNQGWKDSPDAVRWADGRIAHPPLALCEVQGYAYQAAMGGAELLEAVQSPDAARCREWAATLRERFRARFWVRDDVGRYPAIALDRSGHPIDAATSNMGHLLGTGLLDSDEAAAVAARLAQPDLDAGYGVRTLSARNGGFNPFSYHRGSIWPHDTAITMLGLIAEGYDAQARSLARQLVEVAEHFDYRLPELYGGTDSRREPVTAYPAACTPQAWSAAAGVAAVGVLAGWTHPMAERARISHR